MIWFTPLPSCIHNVLNSLKSSLVIYIWTFSKTQYDNVCRKADGRSYLEWRTAVKWAGPWSPTPSVREKKNKKMNYVQQELEKRVVWTTCSPARSLNCSVLSLDWNSSSHSSAGGSLAVSAPKALSLVLFTSQNPHRERKWVSWWKTKCGPVPISLNANFYKLPDDRMSMDVPAATFQTCCYWLKNWDCPIDLFILELFITKILKLVMQNVIL